MDAKGPPSARRGGFFLVMSNIAWALLVLSALFCILVTWQGINFSYQVTCEATAPTEWRQSIVFTGLGLYLACALPATFLLVRGRQIGTLVALSLACLGIAISFFTFVIPLFSAAMC